MKAMIPARKLKIQEAQTVAMAGATPAEVTREAGATLGEGAASRAVAILGEATLGAGAILAEVHLAGDKMTAGGTPRMTNGFRN
jgi:hypothetical protein